MYADRDYLLLNIDSQKISWMMPHSKKNYKQKTEKKKETKVSFNIYTYIYIYIHKQTNDKTATTTTKCRQANKRQ